MNFQQLLLLETLVQMDWKPAQKALSACSKLDPFQGECNVVCKFLCSLTNICSYSLILVCSFSILRTSKALAANRMEVGWFKNTSKCAECTGVVHSFHLGHLCRLSSFQPRAPWKASLRCLLCGPHLFLQSATTCIHSALSLLSLPNTLRRVQNHSPLSLLLLPHFLIQYTSFKLLFIRFQSTSNAFFILCIVFMFYTQIFCFS